MGAGVAEQLHNPGNYLMKEFQLNMIRILGSVIVIISIYSKEISAQYQGGDADGLASQSLASSISPPIHCYGGG